ncbi:hypothetical protein [Streptomyces sp. NRRL WC-3549]|nr:hypothetical protein [Streptomyces sp. NRRL WC-3549]
MARLIPLVLLGLAVYFWLRTRKKTAAYLASYESVDDPARDRRDPPAPAA